MLPSWSPRIILDEDRLAKADFMNTEFYNDFFRPFGFHSSVAIGLEIEGHQGGTLDILRAPQKGGFSDVELSFCAQAQPHLVRAFRLGRKLAAGRELENGMADRFEQAAFGVIILSADGQVRQMNPAAADVTRRGAGLRVVKGRLAALDEDAGRRLEVLIGRAGDRDPEHRSGGSMAVPVPHRSLPLSLLVVPVRTERRAVFSQPSVMVCITDLERGLDLPAERLRQLFGLTPAESRVALALFEGGDIPTAAAAVGISVNTAKIHLTHIFEKTGTNRQGALIKLMTRCVQDALGE
jgi:DNA-binding CsgD family transcriptional regulator/PAS domain-containing protein